MARGKRRRGPRSRSSGGVVLALVLLAAACAGGEGPVEVFAAASLTGAFEELEERFEASTSGADVRITFAGSSTLREQLRDGAAADVFVSANASVMNALVVDGDISAEPVDLVANRLVLAVPADNPAGVVGLADLAIDDLLVGVCAVGVPCGDLAVAWLAEVGVEASFDTAETDVRSLTRRLADGELDAALVYATDVAAENGRIIEVDTSDTPGPSTTYPLVVLSGRGEAFGRFALGPDGDEVLARWGFGQP